MIAARPTLPVFRMLLTVLVAVGLLLGPLTAEAAHEDPEAVHCVEHQCAADPADHAPDDGHEHHKAHGCSSCHLHLYASFLEAPHQSVFGALNRPLRSGNAPRLAGPEGPLRPPRV
ncbi:hypothetical protein [Parvularcula bermudensis]|uniref:hypothetical protein n=1 Tax=Parvularcula bermudensis TaxID=208216 RepID=UPI0003236BE1|nr:hypothetical protein [Parvularcula bermudensis]